MQVFVESLGDPIWQIGVGSIALVVLVLIVVLRSPDVRLTPWQQWFLPRIIGLVCLSLFLVLSAGVVLSHGADATPTSVNATRSHASVTSTPPELPSPTPVPTPSPKPFPHLSPTPAQVLTTFCDAIDQHDLNGAWGQHATRLQKERTEPPPPHGWFKIVECSIGEVSDTSAIGLLQLQTIEPGGYAGGVERPFQFTLSVEDGAWLPLPLSCQGRRLVPEREVTHFTSRGTEARKNALLMTHIQRVYLEVNNNNFRDTRDGCPAQTVNAWRLRESISPAVACD